MSQDLTLSPAWAELQAEAGAVGRARLRDLFAADPERARTLSLACGDLFVDFSKQRLTAATLARLRALARARGLEARIAELFAGERVNVTENRAAMHMALRAQAGDRYAVDGGDVVATVLQEREKLGACCAALMSGAWRGVGGKPITDVVNLGIGGSDLGPRMAKQALAACAMPGRQVHFVSNVDGADLAALLARLEPQSTLFIVVSKTFTTQETMLNARSALAWLLAGMGGGERQEVLARHMLAVSANVAAAQAFGIPAANVFAFWDWVGGRYSLCSSVGLSLALAIGMENFEAMLAGAAAMDRHFRSAALEQNLPATLALVDVWNTGLLGAQTRAVVPYSASLGLLPAYLQQLEMESNGKSVRADGGTLTGSAAPVVWGSAGTDAQHSYFQLLHQGGRLVPIDFIAFAQPDLDLPGHHPLLLANCLGQSEALMRGRSAAEARQEMQDAGVAPAQIERLLAHKIFPGNQPSTTLLMPRLTPQALGTLIALYEHKVFAAAAIWGINPFDQFGVELGKEMAGALLPALSGAEPAAQLSSSTRQLVAYCRRHETGGSR